MIETITEAELMAEIERLAPCPKTVPRFTEQQSRFIRLAREKRVSWKDIAVSYNRLFGGNFTAAQLNSKFYHENN